MGTDNKVLDITREAAEDLSSDQYKFVVIDSTSGKARRPDSALERASGILQNAPAAGEAAVIRPVGCGGISLLQVNAALGIGDIVRPEYVGAADAGKGATAGNSGLGAAVLLEASSAEDDLVSCLLLSMQPQIIKGAGIHMTTGGAAAEDISVPGVVNTDAVIVTLHTAGAVPRTISSVVSAADKITVTFSGDPSNDHKVNYLVLAPVS